MPQTPSDAAVQEGTPRRRRRPPVDPGV